MDDQQASGTVSIGSLTPPNPNNTNPNSNQSQPSSSIASSYVKPIKAPKSRIKPKYDYDDDEVDISEIYNPDDDDDDIN